MSTSMTPEFSVPRTGYWRSHPGACKVLTIWTSVLSCVISCVISSGGFGVVLSGLFQIFLGLFKGSFVYSELDA